jgi:hypothetical protein
VAVRNATLGQVVGGEFQRHAVAIHDFDAVAPESAGHGREHLGTGLELDLKHSGFEFFDYFTGYFDCVFFGQMFFLWFEL